MMLSALPSPTNMDASLHEPVDAYGIANFLSFETPNAGLLARGTTTTTTTMAPPFSPDTAALAQAAAQAMSTVSTSPSPPPPPPPQPMASSSLLTAATVLPPLPSPADFATFYEYDRHQYDLATNPEMRRQVRLSSLAMSMQSLMNTVKSEHPDVDTPESIATSASAAAAAAAAPPSAIIPPALLDPARQAEARRQIHIQSEQKRRAQIKDGFDELRRQLPNCHSKKLSKAVILSRTTVYLQQLKQHALQLQAEVERLAEENSRLRRAAGLPDDDRNDNKPDLPITAFL